MRRPPSVEDYARMTQRSREVAYQLLVTEQETYQSRLDVLAERARRAQETEDPDATRAAARRLKPIYERRHGDTPTLQAARRDAMQTEPDGAETRRRETRAA